MRGGVVCLGIAAALAVAMPAVAIVFGTVKGVIHDPQHRPIPGATVMLTARGADLMRTTTTGPDGAFEFQAVPVGEYTISASLLGFQTVEQLVTVVSSASPVLHLELPIAAVSQAVTVRAPQATTINSATPTTVVTQRDILMTPGADQTNSAAAITAYVPGAYVVHDQLHVRGGHQVTWLIDGVPVPNTNIASDVGPQFDPKDVDVLEAQRGSYGAQYGDRTYAIFNVVPRTGFERNREAELVLSAGQFFQTNDQVSIGDHTRRLGYYTSATVSRSDLGLDTPVPEVLHDRQYGFGGFGSLVFNANPNNQLRVVTAARADRYQIPNGPAEQQAGIEDTEHESDALLNATWARTFANGRLLTVSPFVHQKRANFDGGPTDPVRTTDHHQSRYAGAQATIGADFGRHTIQVGFYGFRQTDLQTIGVTLADETDPAVAASAQPAGHLEAVFAEDRFAAVDWLTVTLGIRQTHFSGAVQENASSPRVGATLQVPRTTISVRGFYGRFYQAPPLITASGPLVDFVTSENLGLIPLRGERDEEYQVGGTLPFRGWALDADRFQTSAENFFDHNPVGNSNVFFPLTIARATIRGWEATLRSPHAWSRGQLHVAFSHQHATAHGPITGGLTDFAPAEDEEFPLDHDQRDTLSVGGTVTLPHGLFAAANLYYGSGFPDDDTGAYLSGHTTVDMTVGHTWSDRFSIAITVLNVTDRHLLVDNSLTFGGRHFNRPREAYAQVRYRFGY